MHFKAIPILEKDDDESQSFPLQLDGSTVHARSFVQLLDQYKVLILQKQSQDQEQEQPDADDAIATTTTTSVNEFIEFLCNVHLDYYPYIGGAAPRTVIPIDPNQFQSQQHHQDVLKEHSDILFTANESPPDQPIPFHHELAQTKQPPNYIFFYCETPCTTSSEGGGETPVIDSTLVYRYVSEHHPMFLQKIQQYGVKYIRTLPGGTTDVTSPIGRSYQDTYQVQNKTELELKLRQDHPNCTWEWLLDDDHPTKEQDDDDFINVSVRITSESIPAVRLITDSTSNKNYNFQYTFFNSIIAAYLGWQDDRNDRTQSIRYGNDDIIETTILDDIAQYMMKHRVCYKWKKGDIMAIQNQLVMHSRNPYDPSIKRKVYASIWGGLKSHVVNEIPSNGIAIVTKSEQWKSYQPLYPADPLVFGFWKVPKEKCAEICYQAIQSGYRRLDCACDYGNEKQIGIGIQRAIHDKIITTRSDLFITSKLWNTYHNPIHVPIALQRSLDDLQISYLDEYLIHFPISMEYVPIEKKYPPEWTNLDGKMVLVPNDITGGTWQAMEKLVDTGLCRFIGVCNFNIQLLRQLLSTCRIRPSTLQIEIHPHYNQMKLVRFAQDANMKVMAFSILGATSYIELNMATSDDLLLYHPTILQIGKKYNKTSAQIMIRWLVQRNILPISKSCHVERMIENRTVFDFTLSQQNDMKQINSLHINRRYNDPGQFCEPGMETFCPIYE